jgi:hypothetical protein
MRFCLEDEIKVKQEKIDLLYFNNFDLIEEFPKNFLRRLLKKQNGTIIEYDFFKKKDCYTYLVQFNNEVKLWFLEDEMLLI